LIKAAPTINMNKVVMVLPTSKVARLLCISVWFRHNMSNWPLYFIS